jgi:hypothetical protein
MVSPFHHLITLGLGTNLGVGQSEDVVQGDGSRRWWSRQDGFDCTGELTHAILGLAKLTYQFTMSSFVEVRLSYLFLAWPLN